MRNAFILGETMCRFIVLLCYISLTYSHVSVTLTRNDIDETRGLRGDPTQPLHSMNVPYVDRFSTCFACNIFLSTTVENKNLYDASSLTAIESAIHRVMEEPLDSIVYERDPNRLCAFTDGVDRPIQQGLINFAITKELIQPTYTWEFQEMVDFFTNKIENAVTSGTFATILLEEIDTHNAVLLQYGQFGRVVSRVTTAEVTTNGVLNTLPRPSVEPTSEPSSMPTLAPTLNVSNIESSSPHRDFDYYARRTAPVYCIVIVLLFMTFVICCVETKSSKDKKALAALKEKEKEIELQKSKQEKDGSAERVLPTVCYEASPEVVNRAFIYIKPHAASAQELPTFIRNFFESKKIFRIVGEGKLSAKWAHDGFEKQYRTMHKISFLVKPSEHNLSMKEKELFFSKFALTWESAVEDELVKNVPESCTALSVDQSELCNLWMTCIEKKQMVKLNESFYCGLIDFVTDVEPIYCINGFFMSMRAEYILYSTPMPYFLVEWSSSADISDKARRKSQFQKGNGNETNLPIDEDGLSWKNFNKLIIGHANPVTAHSDSLRACINANWENLHLTAPLDMKDNAIHSSSSAFEALAERTQWLSAPTFGDPLGYALNILGVTPALLDEWFQNPIIKGQPIFDHFKNLGCKQSIEVAYKLLLWNTAIKNGVSQEEIGKSFHEDSITARNCAFMYIKPHANNFTCQNFVRDYLKKHNFIITLEGNFDAEYMSEGACIDKQYATMAKKSLSSPSKLDLSDEILSDFEVQFGVTWESVIASSQVLGVVEAAEFLEMSDKALTNMWLDIVMKNPKKMIKLERSVYCCLVDCIPEKQPFFCINGFFMGMRIEYNVSPGSIHYFLVEWNSDMLDWKAFRNQIVGSRNPFEAEPDSLRRCIATQWLDLKLQHPLDVMNNAIHASSSAFESCIERSIWFKTPLEKDAMFGQKLLAAGIPLDTLKEWSFNPKLFDKCIFDYMINLDSAECIEKAKVLIKRSNPDIDLRQHHPMSPPVASERPLSSSAPVARTTPRLGTPHPTAGTTTVPPKSRRRTSVRKQSSAVPSLSLGKRQVARVTPIEEGDDHSEADNKDRKKSLPPLQHSTPTQALVGGKRRSSNLRLGKEELKEGDGSVQNAEDDKSQGDSHEEDSLHTLPNHHHQQQQKNDYDPSSPWHASAGRIHVPPSAHAPRRSLQLSPLTTTGPQNNNPNFGAKRKKSVML